MAKLFNRAKMTTTTTGSGTITLGSASNGFQSFADAGVANGDVVQYVIEEGANFEIGTGTYSATGTTLSRSPSESSNSNNAITLAGQATVSITAVADDLNRLQHNGTDKVTVSSTGASVTGNLAVSGTVDGVDVSARDAVLTSTKTTADAALPKSGGTMSGALTVDQSTAATPSLTVRNSGGHANNAVVAKFYGDSDGIEIVNHAAGDYKIRNPQQDNGVSIYDGTGGVKLRYNGSDVAGVDSTGGFEVTSGNLHVTNSINVGGTVDGVDIAARDGVLTSTTTTANAALPKAGGTMTGALDLEGGSFSSGVDTNTNAALVVASGKQILGDDGNYLRNLVKWTSGNQIEVGQGSTALITGINLLAGSTGTVKANGQRVFAEDYHPNADKWTTSRTLSLTGGVTGSVSWDGSANASLTSTVALATASAVGGIKIGYTENGKNYPVELDANGKAFVNVPWTDTNTNQLTTFQLEDGDGTEVTISHGKEVKFVEGGGIDINWTDTSTGSDGDPYDLTFTVSESGHYHDRNRIYDNRAAGDVLPDDLPEKMVYFTFTDDLPDTGNTWDSVINMKGWSDGYRAWQLASNSGNGDGNTGLYFRSGEDSSWGTMQRVFADDYHPNADKWTDARTLSLTGDVTGSVSIDGSANASITTTVGNDSHTHAFNNLTSKTSGTGEYSTSGNLTSGRGSGGVSLTINDGYGNANVTWNHKNGVPEQNGQAARIVVNTDSTTGEGYFDFDVSSSAVTSGTAVDLPLAMRLGPTYMDIPNQIRHSGDTDTYMQFHAADSWRVVTGGTERIEATNSGIRIDDAFTLPTTDGSANQVLVTNGSGTVSWATQTDTNTNQLTTFVVQDGDSTNVTISQGKYLKFAEGGAIDVNFTDTSTGSSGDPYDLTISHADTSSQGSVNNSNGTVIQDVTLDTYGHVTGLGSVDLDNRYQQISDKEFFSITNSGTTAGTWLGSHDDITAYFDGMTIAFYQNGLAGASTTTLNINSLGAKTIYYANDSKLTTHYGSRALIMLQYDSDQDRFYAHDFYYSDANYNLRWNLDITVNNSAGSGTAVHGYQILLEGADGKFYPCTEGGSTGNTNAVSTADLKIGGTMLIYNSSTDYAANATLTSSSLWAALETGTMEYWNNRDSGWATADRPIYFVGTVQSNGSFRLDNTSYTSFLTQDLPTSDDGKIYIKIGWMADNYDDFRLENNHPIYVYKDGSIKEYAGFAEYAGEAAKWSTSRTLSLSGDASGSVSWDGSANATLSVTVANDSHSHSNYAQTNVSSVTFDGGTSTTVNVKCDDGGMAMVRATGDSQGTGAVEVGQSNSYGGGMSYNGDGSPAFVSGETADNITFYRMDNGTRTEVFHYPYNSNTVTFNGQVNVGSTLTLPDKIQHTSDSDTYMQFHENDQWRVVTGGTERLEVNNDTSTFATDVAVDTSHKLTFGSSTRQMIDLWSTSYGIGVQSNTQYFRTASRFSWHRGGSHTGTENDAGTGGTVAMTLDSSSNLSVTGNVNTASDARLKDNINQITDALGKIGAIRGVTYNRNDIDGNPRQAGVIAQEVEEVLPEVVLTDDDGYKSVAYGNMVGLLIEAIKEQQTQIDTLTVQVEKLKR